MNGHTIKGPRPSRAKVDNMPKTRVPAIIASPAMRQAVERTRELHALPSLIGGRLVHAPGKPA